jgi:hypothetical protein
MTEIEKLQQQVSEYEAILGVGKNDLAKRSFISYCKAVKKLSDRVKNITASGEDGAFTKEDTDLVTKMPKMINDVVDLREKLKLSNNEIEEAFVDGIAEKRP